MAGAGGERVDRDRDRGRIVSTALTLLRRVDQTGVPLLAIRVVIGGMFLWMGYKKVLEPVEFLKLIRLYRMVPEEPAVYLNLIAVVLPWLEVVAGTALILGVFIRGAGLLIAGMLAVFTPVILIRALQMMSAESIPFTQVAFDCGCGSGVVVIWKKLLSNTGLFILSLIPICSGSSWLCLGNLSLWRRDIPPARPHGSRVEPSPLPMARPPNAQRDQAPVA